MSILRRAAGRSFSRTETVAVLAMGSIKVLGMEEFE